MSLSVTATTMLKYRAEIGDRELDFGLHEKVCSGCRRRFLGRGSSWCAPHYCSKACQMEARKLRRAESRTKPRDRCVHCNRPLDEPRRSTRLYCSVRCRVAAHRGR